MRPPEVAVCEVDGFRKALIPSSVARDRAQAKRATSEFRSNDHVETQRRQAAQESFQQAI